MEEKKNTKVVKMNTTRDNKEKEQKLTYEQLNEACQQLFQQNQYLVKQVKQLSETNMLKRLDYLFKVVELSSSFKDSDFINSCIDEIKDALTVSDDEEQGEK